MKLFSVVMNAISPAALAKFWQQALGGTLTDQGDYVLLEVSAAGPRILFQHVNRHDHGPGRFHSTVNAGRPIVQPMTPVPTR